MILIMIIPEKTPCYLCMYIYIYILTHTHTPMYIYIYIISRRNITPQQIKNSSKSLDVVQSLFFRNVQIKRNKFVSLYLYVPDEGSLLPKYRDCTTSNDFELCIYIYIYVA